MKISMVMPVYNEAKLLPCHLELAAPFVDEIILVDGSPAGPSTDGTKDLIEYNNVEIIEGKFELAGRKGGWDKAAQLRMGVEKATGDMLIITSCDNVFGDYEMLVETIKEHPEGKVFYCFLTEFFIDCSHVRMINIPDFPMPQISCGIFQKRLFTTKEHTWFARSLVEPVDYIFLQDVHKYHYGWVTDFDKQVAKHIRNVRSGGWLEYGERILSSGEQALETWAITHILSYTKEIVFPYAVAKGFHPLHCLEFNYREKFDKVVMDFKAKYKKDYYDCI